MGAWYTEIAQMLLETTEVAGQKAWGVVTSDQQDLNKAHTVHITPIQSVKGHLLRAHHSTGIRLFQLG